jgi:hypothetical protein
MAHIFLTSVIMEVNGQLRIPVALSQKKNLGGSEGQSGSVEKRKISAPE